ncbi:MAG: F0F1 ATP synthase subunit A [Verrucomicrobiales bacterium]
MRSILSITSLWLLAPLAAFAGEEGGHHALPLHAEKVFGLSWVTNSMVMVWIAALLVILFAKVATRQISLIPSGLQNLAEWLVESLYDFLEGILGAHLVKRTFWFFGGVFVLILFTNWIGLLPGVGTVKYDGVPILRGGNADLNMTSALSILFTILWFYWALSENGLGGFLKHIFAPKGEFKGFMKLFMIIIFFLVGVIEVFSILLRPVALSFRLFGNIYAGENMLETMMNMVPKGLAFLPALPFYFLELLVGLIQALVFMLLTSVFLKLICDHGDDHKEDHAH